MKRLIPLLVLLFVVNGCRSAKPVPPPEPAPLVVKEQTSELFCPPPCNLAPYAKPGEVVLLPPMTIGEAQKLVEPTKPPAPDQRVPGAFLRRVGARARAVQTVSKGKAKIVVGEPPAASASPVVVSGPKPKATAATKPTTPAKGEEKTRKWWFVLIPCGIVLAGVILQLVTGKRVK